MKCPQCGHNQPARRGTICDACQYRFTFNPKESETFGLTDGKFLAAVNRASQNGTAAFTSNQLYTAYASKITSPRIALAVITCVFGAAGTLLALLEEQFLGIAFLCIAMVVGAGALIAKPSVLWREHFMDAIGKWIDQGKPIDGLIRMPDLTTPPENWDEHDIYDYGAERILIVQHDILVDLMVKNNQHAEQRMVVIAESGYPEYTIAHVNRLLDERQDLPVHLLHDGGTTGEQMPRRVRSLSWLHLRAHPVVDMGFFAEDIKKVEEARLYNGLRSEREFPADALIITALATGMAACFANQSSLADEIVRHHRNVAEAGSSFG